MFAKSLLMFTLGLVASSSANNDFAMHRLYMQQLLEEEADAIHGADHGHDAHHDTHHDVHHDVHHGDLSAHHEIYDHHDEQLIDHGRAHPEEYLARTEHVKEIPHGCLDSKFCHTFSKFAQRNDASFSHSNSLMTTYYVVPDSLTIHEDSIHA